MNEYRLFAQLAIPLIVGGGFGWISAHLFPFRIGTMVFLAGIAVEFAWIIYSTERAHRAFQRDFDRLLKFHEAGAAHEGSPGNEA